MYIPVVRVCIFILYTARHQAARRLMNCTLYKQEDCIITRRFPATENGRRAERSVGRAGFDRKEILSGLVDSEFRLRVS